MARYPTRSASFAITLLGVLANSFITLQIISYWRSIKWEPESEWESSSDKWALNGIKIGWGVLLAYFSSAVVVCLIGLVGVVKSKSPLVKFYRDYSLVDFSFCALFTLFAAYCATLPSTPLGLCEGITRQPELMRDLDLADLGLSSENCERWFKRSALALLGFMVLVLVARLHFILAISIYYSHLFRHYPGRIPLSSTHHSHSHSHSHNHSHSRSRSRKSTDSLQKVYLLPRSITELQTSSVPASSVSPVSDPGSPTADEDIIMYAPVPLSKLPKEVALKLKTAAVTMEGWVRTTTPGQSVSVSSSSSSTPISPTSPTSSTERSERPHRHQHRHHRSHSSLSTRDVMTGAGEINLPILPEEGLFDHLWKVEEKV